MQGWKPQRCLSSINVGMLCPESGPGLLADTEIMKILKLLNPSPRPPPLLHHNCLVINLSLYLSQPQPWLDSVFTSR